MTRPDPLDSINYRLGRIDEKLESLVVLHTRVTDLEDAQTNPARDRYLTTTEVHAVRLAAKIGAGLGAMGTLAGGAVIASHLAHIGVIAWTIPH